MRNVNHLCVKRLFSLRKRGVRREKRQLSPAPMFRGRGVVVKTAVSRPKAEPKKPWVRTQPKQRLSGKKFTISQTLPLPPPHLPRSA